MIRWGLIGASSFAEEVMIDALRRGQRSEVVGVYSASTARGSDFAARHGLECAYPSLEAMLGDRTVDAVYVSTTNDLHAEQVIAAAHAGKHVLCEKPLATRLADAWAMRDACRDAGVTFGVNHHMRCQDTVREMRRLIEAGAIGPLVGARISFLASLVEHRRTWRVTTPAAGAGVVLDLTVHDADTLRFVLDDEIEAVSAMATTHGVATNGIEDTVAGVMRTRGGLLVPFHDAFTSAHAGTALEVYGEAGALMGRDLLGALPAGHVVLRRDDDAQPVELGDRMNPYERLVNAFLDAIDGTGPLAASAEDGIASLAIALAVLDAARTAQTVPVPA